jgi:hypothetical protein
VIYCIGNLSLNALNWLWFSKMFCKTMARLSGDTKSGKGEKQPLLEKLGTPESEGETEGEMEGEKKVEVEGEEGEEGESLTLPANPPSPVKSMGRPERDW